MEVCGGGGMRLWRVGGWESRGVGWMVIVRDGKRPTLVVCGGKG